MPLKRSFYLRWDQSSLSYMASGANDTARSGSAFLYRPPRKSDPRLNDLLYIYSSRADEMAPWRQGTFPMVQSSPGGP